MTLRLCISPEIYYTYKIPMLLIGTLRGAAGDDHEHPVANGVYLGVLDAINMPNTIIDKPGENLADVKVLSPQAHRLPAHGVLLTRDSVEREPQMNYIECFRTIARHRTHELVVTSAGNSSQAWWEVTRDSEASFYLDASMSLSTMFASGLALARPEQRVWAFMGDGAFCMNPGMLMVEREMSLPNLTHFLVSNRAYGATSNAGLPNVQNNDYAAIARSMGLDRIFEFRSIEEIEHHFSALHSANLPGHTFVVLEVEPFSETEQRLEQPPFDGPELKYRFGRHLERLTGCDIFGYRT